MTKTNDDTQDSVQQGRLREGYGAAVDTVSHALDSTRKKTSQAIDAASDAASRATHGLESNPLALLVGGIAVGAAIGAMIPRSAKEKDLLAPLGQRLSTTARAAVTAAKDAGRSELEARGLTRDAARDQVKGLFEGVLKAASEAGTAASKSATSQS